MHCAALITNTRILNAVEMTGSIRSESDFQNLFINMNVWEEGICTLVQITKEARGGIRSFWSCCYRQLLCVAADNQTQTEAKRLH